MTTELDYRSFLRLEMMPHMLCPGCGHGIVLKAILRALDRLGLNKDQVAFVSGIGCSSRLVGYVDACSLHTTHGRPITFATGLKLARPDLHVIVITGDGDGLAIGGNHLIHAARRNIDITCLLLNNAIYGMTGGQGAPTTPLGGISTTTPTGAFEPSFDACKLAIGAGATFVARGLTAAPLELDDLIAAGLQHRGFSFLEVYSDCPEFYGRYNRLGKGPEMMTLQRRQQDYVEAPLALKRFVGPLPPRKPRPGPGTGVLYQETRPELTQQYRQFVQQRPAAQGEHTRPATEQHQAWAAPGAERSGAAQYQVRLAGAGGQGIVLAGLLLAEAAVLAGMNATHAQAYGPESRGGASKADVILSQGEIDYPYASDLDVLLALTQEACEKYAAELKPGGLLLVDQDKVLRPPAQGIVWRALPFLATATRQLGTTVGANLVALGALIGLAGLVSVEAAEAAIVARRPGGAAEPGLRALRAGLELAAHAGRPENGHRG
jgi:2-oxoglutarate ferredoxin oxidoreductase subunit beta